jgi:hypothetical protein
VLRLFVELVVDLVEVVREHQIEVEVAIGAQNSDSSLALHPLRARLAGAQLDLRLRCAGRGAAAPAMFTPMPAMSSASSRSRLSTGGV